jgi:hypothetical protein
MNKEYQDLEAYLKIVYQNFSTMHHNMTGCEFFTIHPLMGEFYDKIAEINDSLIERGMVDGIAEPSIKDAVLAFGGELVPVAPIDCWDALVKARDEFNAVLMKMDSLRASVAPDIQSQIDAWEYEIKIYLYKIGQYLTKDDEDDE